MPTVSSHPNCLPCDGELYWLPGFYPNALANQHYQCLYEGIAWQSETLFIYGRRVAVPRLLAWYGDSGAYYRYSGLNHAPQPWVDELLPLRQDVETVCQHRFNSVLANLYRDGRDSMGSHADDEPELGRNPLIASLSFGATRLLRFRHRQNGQRLDLELAHGDLLIMAGSLQHHWRHELPKTRRPTAPRINLTFRHVKPV